MEELAACGAHAATRRELAENAEVVITMLPNGPQVKEVMLGEVANYMHAGQIFIDCSSISPVVSKEIAAVLAEKNIEMLDAPVSGGEPKAIDGTLAFMVGGKQEVFDTCKDILAAMGSSVTRCGDVGAGNTTKQAIRGGLAGSTVMDAKGPMMIAGNDKPGFKIDLHIKDLNNALDCAHTVGAPVPMTAAVQEILQWLHNHDCGGNDHSAIAKYYEHLTGIQIGR